MQPSFPKWRRYTGHSLCTRDIHNHDPCPLVPSESTLLHQMAGVHKIDWDESVYFGYFPPHMSEYEKKNSTTFVKHRWVHKNFMLLIQSGVDGMMWFGFSILLCMHYALHPYTTEKKTDTTSEIWKMGPGNPAVKLDIESFFRISASQMFVPFSKIFSRPFETLYQLQVIYIHGVRWYNWNPPSCYQTFLCCLI